MFYRSEVLSAEEVGEGEEEGEEDPAHRGEGTTGESVPNLK